MIQVTAHVQIYIYIPPVDFRMGLDCLINFCERHIDEKPFSGNLYLFRSRKKSSIKMVTYDGQGWWLIQKRLSIGKFKWWPNANDEKIKINMYELQVLIGNGDPSCCNSGMAWRKISK